MSAEVNPDDVAANTLSSGTMPILAPADSAGLVEQGGFCTTLDMGICFAAGTPVLMADGTTKPIETLQSGDQVLAAPEHDAEAEPAAKTVERVFHNPPSELVILTIGETQLRCTPPHLFYVREKGWTAAEDLEIGDELRTPDGRWVTLDAKEEQSEPEPVFNFRVADYHTYFVGDPAGGKAVLVHNEYASAEDAGKYYVEGLKALRESFRLQEAGGEWQALRDRALRLLRKAVELERDHRMDSPHEGALDLRALAGPLSKIELKGLLIMKLEASPVYQQLLRDHPPIAKIVKDNMIADLERLNIEVLRLTRDRLRTFRPYDWQDELSKAIVKRLKETRGVDLASVIWAGWAELQTEDIWFHRRKADPDTLVHEIGHLVDFAISCEHVNDLNGLLLTKTSVWIDIYLSEIKGALGANADKNAQEGFADFFAQYYYHSQYTREQLKAKFPRAWQFFLDYGIIDDI